MTKPITESLSIFTHRQTVLKPEYTNIALQQLAFNFHTFTPNIFTFLTIPRTRQLSQAFFVSVLRQNQHTTPACPYPTLVLLILPAAGHPNSARSIRASSCASGALRKGVAGFRSLESRVFRWKLLRLPVACAWRGQRSLICMFGEIKSYCNRRKWFKVDLSLYVILTCIEVDM